MSQNQPDPLWRKGIKRVLAWRPVSWIAARWLHRVDRLSYRLSDGHYTITSVIGGVPMIRLTITGAKSGRKRQVPLLGIPDGSEIILIASNWGQERHPSWYYNLLKNPQVSVAIRGKEAPYYARITEVSEHDHYYGKAAAIYGGYEAYKQRTGGREIPVVVLTPLEVID